MSNKPVVRTVDVGGEPTEVMSLDDFARFIGQDPAAVRDVARRTGARLQLLLETALGLSRALELATAHEQVHGIGLGEADLAADLLVVDGAPDLDIHALRRPLLVVRQGATIAPTRLADPTLRLEPGGAPLA